MFAVFAMPRKARRYQTKRVRREELDSAAEPLATVEEGEYSDYSDDCASEPSRPPQQPERELCCFCVDAAVFREMRDVLIAVCMILWLGSIIVNDDLPMVLLQPPPPTPPTPPAPPEVSHHWVSERK